MAYHKRRINVLQEHKRFIEDVVERALVGVGLDGDGFRRIVDHADEFQADIMASIKNHTMDKFMNEEAASNYGYSSGYKKPKSMAEQVQILRHFFPGIGHTDETIAERSLPPNTACEGYFAIPNWQRVAKTYGEACQKVFGMIRKTRNGKFHNYREGKLGPQHLRQSERSIEEWQNLADEQKDRDILVVAAQFGFKYRGRSVRRALEIMSSAEFGLGVFAIGIMILTHPERFQDLDDLWVDCVGDEFNFGASDRRGDSPYFRFVNDKIEFGARNVSDACARYGSASAFV